LKKWIHEKGREIKDVTPYVNFSADSNFLARNADNWIRLFFLKKLSSIPQNFHFVE